MKRLAILLAVFLFAVTPLFAVGRATHHVVVAGHLRVLLPIGYENRLPSDRVLFGAAPRVDYACTVELSDTPDFSHVIASKDLSGSVFLRDGLPLVVPHYDGITNYAGTSGFYLLDVFETRIRVAFETMGTQLYWRIAQDSALVVSAGFDTIDPRLGMIDLSQVDVSGLPVSP